jgi:hypothetical protein
VSNCAAAFTAQSIADAALMGWHVLDSGACEVAHAAGGNLPHGGCDRKLDDLAKVMIREKLWSAALIVIFQTCPVSAASHGHGLTWSDNVKIHAKSNA